MIKLNTLMLFVIMILIGCSSPITEIPLENFKEHRQFLEERTENKSEDFQEYEKLLIENPKLGDLPYIYYYLSRLEDNQEYLTKGLELFPNDPWINFNKNNYLSDEESHNLYKKILKDHPRHNASFINYIYFYDDFLSQTFTRTLFLENSSLINELYSMVTNYEKGDPKSSEFYDFNSKNQSLSDFRKNYVNNQISIIKTLYKDLEIQREQIIKERRQKINSLIGNTYSLDYFHQINFKSQNRYWIYQRPLNCGGYGRWSVQGDYIVLEYNDSNCGSTRNMSGKYPLTKFN